MKGDRKPRVERPYQPRVLYHGSSLSTLQQALQGPVSAAPGVESLAGPLRLSNFSYVEAEAAFARKHIAGSPGDLAVLLLIDADRLRYSLNDSGAGDFCVHYWETPRANLDSGFLIFEEIRGYCSGDEAWLEEQASYWAHEVPRMACADLLTRNLSYLAPERLIR